MEVYSSDVSGCHLGASITPQTWSIWPVLCAVTPPPAGVLRCSSSCHSTTRVTHPLPVRIFSDDSRSSLFSHLLSGDTPFALSFCYLIDARFARMVGMISLITVDLVHIPSLSRTYLCRGQVGDPGIYFLARHTICSLLILHPSPANPNIKIIATSNITYLPTCLATCKTSTLVHCPYIVLYQSCILTHISTSTISTRLAVHSPHDAFSHSSPSLYAYLQNCLQHFANP